MEIIELVDKLETMAGQAKKVPITGRAMIDAERLLELIDQMRLAIPRNIQDAQEVMDRREQIVNQTMLDARRIRVTAEGDARTLVEESELVKSAKRRSDEILEDAGHKAERMIALGEKEGRERRHGADVYCQDALAKLEEEVAAVLGTIHAGQRVLAPAPELLPEPENEPAISSN